jgi:hypothetical protein
VTAMTPRVPQPLAADGVVTNDVAARTLVVRLSERAEGYGRLLWREGHQALVKAEESGWRSRVTTVWASALGSGRDANSPEPGRTPL